MNSEVEVKGKKNKDDKLKKKIKARIKKRWRINERQAYKRNKHFKKLQRGESKINPYDIFNRCTLTKKEKAKKEKK